MSRIGKQPIQLKDKVEVKIVKKKLTIKGPQGELIVDLPYHLEAEVKDEDGEKKLFITRNGDDDFIRSLHGTFRMIAYNAVQGVIEKYEKKLEMEGLGYRGKIQGGKLSLSLGFTHPVEMEIPEDLDVEMPDEVSIVIKGVDKQLVGEYAAKIRSLRKPEPYKGKGIRYSDEKVRRKSPKASMVGGEGAEI